MFHIPRACWRCTGARPSSCCQSPRGFASRICGSQVSSSSSRLLCFSWNIEEAPFQVAILLRSPWPEGAAICCTPAGPRLLVVRQLLEQVDELLIRSVAGVIDVVQVLELHDELVIAHLAECTGAGIALHESHVERLFIGRRRGLGHLDTRPTYLLVVAHHATSELVQSMRVSINRVIVQN